MKRERKLALAEWAAIGELIAAVAVVISLIFVAYSVRQNTDAVHGAMENLLFERHAEIANYFIADPSMAEILVKMRSRDSLTDIETIRWEKYRLNLLDIWDLAFLRYQSGLLAERHWKAWDEYFAHLFTHGAEKLSREYWNQVHFGYDEEFWEHVNESVFEKGK